MIHQAIEFAAKAHEKQVRKGTKLPYIIHPAETALILAQEGAGEELICAALLHDTLEDTDITKEELEAQFGSHVADLVLNRSEPKEWSWERRKQHTIDAVKDLGEEGRFLLCADKLANMRSIAWDYRQLGDELWARFRRGKKLQKWYYGELIQELHELRETAMYQELKQIYAEIFESE